MTIEREASWTALMRIYVLWRRQASWLALGVVISLASLVSFIVLLEQSGRNVAIAVVSGLLAAPLLLRLAGVGRVVLRYLERLLTHEATFRALADLRVWFFRGFALRSAGGLGFRRAGDVLSRLVQDVDALDGLYSRIAIPASAAVLLLILLPITLAPHSILLAASVTILFSAAAIALPIAAARNASKAADNLAVEAAGLRIAALDLLGGLREARAFGAEDRLRANLQARELAQQSALDQLSARAAKVQAGAFLCAQAALLVVLAFAATRGRADPLAAVTLVFLAVAAFEAVLLLPRAGALAGHAATSAKRVRQVASGPLGDPPPSDPQALPPGTSLRFEQVRFTWQPDRCPVFEGLNLEVPRGARVAVLGPSGSGKSTLAALALRVAVAQSGRILLGGTDIRRLRAEDVRSRFSWLSQATHLFSDTIRANLLLGHNDADDPSLWQVLKAARLDDVVRDLPDGLDTWVGEAGARLSGGQERRLALARALLSPAPFLILDEPGSGLDSEAERELLITLNDATEGRSLLLITHRLTGVEKLDRVYRLSNGRAVAAAG